MAGRLWTTGVVGLAAVGLGVVGAVPSGATAPGADGMVAFSAFGQIMTARYVDGQMQHRFLTRVGVNLRPRWSPDGSRLAFYTQEGAVKTMNANGQGMRTVVSGGSLPTWQSPSRIAFVKTVGGKGDIYSVASDWRGPVTRLTKDGAATCGNLHPAFSYDGRDLAYVQKRPLAGSCDGELETALKVVDRATGATRVITTVPWSAHGEPPFDLYVEVGRIDFDSSGRHVMFTVDERCGVWPVLDVRNGSYTFSVNHRECGAFSYDNAPLPAGGFAIDVYDTERYQDLDVQPVTS